MLSFLTFWFPLENEELLIYPEENIPVQYQEGFILEDLNKTCNPIIPKDDEGRPYHDYEKQLHLRKLMEKGSDKDQDNQSDLEEDQNH